MNQKFGDNCYHLKVKEGNKYVKINCKYEKCPLDIWLNFTQTPDGKVTNMTLFRFII
jgi:hypothetical protein